MLCNRGVFFGLNSETYHQDASLSFSGIKDLLISPITFWARSGMNPNRTHSTSPAMELGTAFHKRILEGQAAFQSAYAIPPEKGEALDGVEELRNRCSELGLRKTGTLAEMAGRILEVDPDAILWPEIMRQFREEAEGKRVLRRDDAQKIESMALAIAGHPSAKNIFKAGFSEVSIFWTDEATGIPLKARLDYLRPAQIIDLKTFSSTGSGPVHQVVSRAIFTEQYFIQAVVYLEAIRQAKRLMAAGKDNCPSAQFKQEILAAPDHRFFFVFVESGEAPNKAPNIIVREMPGNETLVYQIGDLDFRKGVSLFKKYSEKFGTKPWVSHEPITRISDEEIPLWMIK